ncbi:MAG: rod shape-determining protein MreC [Proteobacteria bacterium]|nr:rod shape-determining protein MreC [Pseudomonadota bacterium]
MAGKRLRFWFLLGGIFIAPLVLFSTNMTPWTSNISGMLKIQMSSLGINLLDHAEQTVELNRLRNLLGFTEKLEDPFTVAEVILGQRKTADKSIRVSKGSLDGVSIGMPVVTAEGVVGRIIRVGSKMSDIQLLVDFGSNIDILIQRNRVRGVLSGFANEECRLNLQRGTEVKIGDTLITSGLTGSFSKGIPVGKVF